MELCSVIRRMWTQISGEEGRKADQTVHKAHQYAPFHIMREMEWKQ